MALPVARLNEIRRRLLDGAGLVGLVVFSAALAATDAVTSLRSDYALVLTALETALIIPWGLLVFGLERRFSSLASAGRKQRADRRSERRALLVHLGIALLLCLCMFQKWGVILSAHGPGAHATERYRVFTVAAYVLANLGLLGHGTRLGRFLLFLSERPARLTALSFGLSGVLGALLLSLPQALRDPGAHAFVDALFTSMSAVCVTGLVVHGTAQTYTAFGQAVILLLIQAGGLGIMVMYAAFTLLPTRRLRVRSATAFADLLDTASLAELRSEIAGVVVYTLALEAVGALALYGLFGAYPDVALAADAGTALSGAGSRAWAAVFHAVSAFCNAGFTVFRDGARPFVADAGVSLALMLLILLGGLGFPVLRELERHVRERIAGTRPRRLSLHARTVVWTSAWLVVVGAALVWIGEARGTLAGRPAGEALLASLFQSVTARTAGFSTLPVGGLSSATLMLIACWMFIGASPGSTGGGVKTTTLAALLASFRAERRGGSSVPLFDRNLADTSVRRALVVFCLGVCALAALMLLLLYVDPGDPRALAFEAVSAFGTVGLSMGVTGGLSTGGKLVIIATMLIGRIGPLTVALALARGRRSSARAQPAEESLRVG